MRVGQEGKSAGVAHRVDQRLWIVCQGGQFLGRAERKQVILLWIAVLVVQLLPDQHQHPAAALLDIALEALHQDVVVGHNHRLQPALEGRRGNVVVTSTPIRVTRVHVQIDRDFVHPGLVDDLPPVQV